MYVPGGVKETHLSWMYSPSRWIWLTREKLKWKRSTRSRWNTLTLDSYSSYCMYLIMSGNHTPSPW